MKIERSFSSDGRTVEVFSSGISVMSQFVISAESCDGIKFSCDVLNFISVEISDDVSVL